MYKSSIPRYNSFDQTSHNQYPYGKVLREFNEATDARYLTTHHERDKETGFDYRGARFYDSDLGRFLSLDPLAMEYPSYSDYSYVLGNPISLIDPTGMAAETTYKDKNGKVLLETNDGSDDVITVSDDKVADFEYYGSVYNGANKGMYDSKVWNDHQKADILGFDKISEMNAVLGSFTTQWARQKGINYIQDPSNANLTAMYGAQTWSQWANPAALLGAASTIAVSLPAPAPRPNVGPITGYTRHGLNQAISRNSGRGVKAAAIKDAALNPKKVVQQANGATKYVGRKASVVLNREGKVITTFGKSRGPSQ